MVTKQQTITAARKAFGRQLAGLRAAANLTQVELEIAEQRVSARGSADVDARLAVWDETWRDIEQHGIGDFDLQIDTDRQCPDGAAHVVRSCLNAALA